MTKDKKISQHILKSKEIKQILSKIEEHWDTEVDLSPNDYVFITNNKDRINIVKKEVFNVEVRPYALGIYFGNIVKDGFRLSLEGSQIVGEKAKKNIVEINREQASKWMSGEDIEVGEINTVKDYVLIKFENDILGCGKYKENYILNYVPKPRRIDMI
jgi:NOL1/NOP2/fmu family ribosome biogenesis protein